MRKILILLTLVWMFDQSNSFATSDSIEGFETRWAMSVSPTPHRLCMELETTKFGDSMPMWGVKITFGERDEGMRAAGVARSLLLGLAMGTNSAGFALAMVEKEREMRRVKRSIVCFFYRIRNDVGAEETRLFLERAGEPLFNRDDNDESPVRRSPSDLSSIGDHFIFRSTLGTPILHVADLYGRLKSVLVRLEIGKIPLPLMFSDRGASADPNKYVRNWNSFIILASSRCFGIPFEINPRLEEYIDDTRLRERWGESKWPTYDKVIELILSSYEDIRGRFPEFRMNSEYVRFLGKRLDGWVYSSGITKQLNRIDKRRGGGAAAAK